MLFNSFPFLVFFVVVTAGYFALPGRARWAWLLGASCYFYMHFIPVYILILGFTIGVDYAAGILIEGAAGARRKWLLAGSIVANVGVLALFKYFNFANANLGALAGFLGWNYSLPALALVLPIGLSFHTFQAMSYTIEVYRGRQPAERHLGLYALYVMFYPQLVAGPIERPQHLLPQFRLAHRFDYDRVVSGLQRMAWGLFKKAVVADRLALVVNPVYGQPEHFGGPALVLATLCFAGQIFCDFSGYSDIAVGAARVMGFSLMENFAAPYHARNLREFWQRWHISLSTWFRDYVYIPLGGNRGSAIRHGANLLAVFLLSGLWHGASWTFVLWGALHGSYLVLGAATLKIRAALAEATRLAARPLLRHALQVGATFGLVSVAWIFFRANSVADAFLILGRLPTGWAELGQWPGLRAVFASLPVARPDLALGLAGAAAVETIQLLQARGARCVQPASWPGWARWGFHYASVAVLFWGYLEATDQFIYFQF